jgi:hypothetical protein
MKLKDLEIEKVRNQMPRYGVACLPARQGDQKTEVGLRM